MNVPAQRPGALSLGVLLFFGLQAIGCSTPPVEHVVMRETRTENGFDVHLGYHTEAPFMLARVSREITLAAQGAVVKTLTLSYWEWFKTQSLPHLEVSWHPDDWAKVEPYAGQPFFLFDRLRDGPGGIATPPPDQFTVTITSTHDLYTGGRITDEGPGQRTDLGAGGYLAADHHGNGPSVYERDGDGTLLRDDTGAWKDRYWPQGTIQRTGTKVLTLSLRHTSTWSRNQTTPDWHAAWTYRRDFGGSTLGDRGHEARSTPAITP